MLALIRLPVGHESLQYQRRRGFSTGEKPSGLTQMKQKACPSLKSQDRSFADTVRRGLLLLPVMLGFLPLVLSCTNESGEPPASLGDTTVVAPTKMEPPTNAPADSPEPTERRLPTSAPAGTPEPSARRLPSSTPTATPEPTERRDPRPASTVATITRETTALAPAATPLPPATAPGQACSGPPTLVQTDPHPARMGNPTTISVPTISEGPMVLDALVEITVEDAGGSIMESYSAATGSWPEELTPGAISQDGWTLELVPMMGQAGRWWILLNYRTINGFEKQLDGSFCVSP